MKAASELACQLQSRSQYSGGVILERKRPHIRAAGPCELTMAGHTHGPWGFPVSYSRFSSDVGVEGRCCQG